MTAKWHSAIALAALLGMVGCGGNGDTARIHPALLDGEPAGTYPAPNHPGGNDMDDNLDQPGDGEGEVAVPDSDGSETGDPGTDNPTDMAGTDDRDGTPDDPHDGAKAMISLFELADNDELPTTGNADFPTPFSYREAVVHRLADAVTVPIHNSDRTFNFENGTDSAQITREADNSFSLRFGRMIESGGYSLGTADGVAGTMMAGDDGIPTRMDEFTGWSVTSRLQNSGEDTPYIARVHLYEDDHLSFGVWLAVTDAPESPDSFRLGAFGHRRETAADPMAANGAAHYSGKATGYRADETGVGSFTADADLSANFDAPLHVPSIGYGSMSGTISNADMVIVLDHASLSGLVVGGEARTDSLIGQWRASFVPVAHAEMQPGGVAGTFGVSDGAAMSIVGGFGAHREPRRDVNPVLPITP